jgi:hypothetical protein
MEEEFWKQQGEVVCEAVGIYASRTIATRLPRLYIEHYPDRRCCQWYSLEPTASSTSIPSERYWLHRYSGLYRHRCRSFRQPDGTRWMLISAQGTPIIDPNTNTVFFFSKGYKNGASNGGVANGECQFFLHRSRVPDIWQASTNFLQLIFSRYRTSRVSQS